MRSLELVDQGRLQGNMVSHFLQPHCLQVFHAGTIWRLSSNEHVVDQTPLRSMVQMLDKGSPRFVRRRSSETCARRKCCAE
mmetsp:Transcript_82230/g.150816  ORF Transcript_82230/g.150816 Transcript_82230/m.150816 type:complete len:81 (+) Transcript_82230:176-418(+)